MKFRDMMTHGSLSRKQLLASLTGGRPAASRTQTQRTRTTNADKSPVAARSTPQKAAGRPEAPKPARAAAAAAPAPKQRKLTDADIQRSEEEQLYNRFYPAGAEPSAALSPQDQDLYEKFYPPAK